MLSDLLIQIGPLPVYVFGVFLAVTFVLGVFLFWRSATKEGFASDPIFDLIFLSTLSALIGGRLSFIVATGEVSDPLAILHVGEGIFWAPTFFVGLVIFYLYIRRRKEWSFLKLADLAAPVVALGQGIGFLGAEATSYLLSVVHVGVGYFGLFLLLELIKRRVTTSGTVFFVYLFLAGLLSFLSEYSRATKAFAFGVDLNYLLAGVLLIGGVLGLLYLLVRSRATTSKVESQPRFRLKIGRGKNASSTN